MKQVTQLPLQDTVTTDKQGLALDLKALALALWEATIELVNKHRVEAGMILGAVCLILMLATMSALSPAKVTADTLTPAIESMVRSDCAGIINARGITDDGKTKACQALASQYNVRLKGINE